MTSAEKLIELLDRITNYSYHWINFISGGKSHYCVIVGARNETFRIFQRYAQIFQSCDKFETALEMAKLEREFEDKTPNLDYSWVLDKA